jgi:hypothetical protein
MRKSLFFIILILLSASLSAHAGPYFSGGGSGSGGVGIYTVLTLPGSPSDGDAAVITDGSTATDCTSGGGTTLNLCLYDAGAAAWVIAGDGTGGAGTGSVTTLEEGDAQVGDADIVYLDFGTGFSLAESPDTEVNVNLDVTPSSGNATLVVEQDAIQVKYASTDFKENSNGLYLADSPTIVTSLSIGSDPADGAAGINLDNADNIAWEASAAGTDVVGMSVDASEVVQIGASGASGVTITPNLTLSGTLTDGTATLNSGAWSGVTTLATSGTATFTLGATDKVHVEGDTTRTGTNPVLDVDATIDTTTAADNVAVIDVVMQRAATDTGQTSGLSVEAISSQTGVSITDNFGIIVVADNDWSPTGDTRFGGIKVDLTPDSFTETATVGMAGFVSNYDSTNLSANSGTVHSYRSDLDHTNATYSVDGIYSFDTALTIGTSSTTDGNVYVINNDTNITGTVTGNVGGWYNDFGDDLDGTMNGYVVGTATIISSGSTGTFGDGAGDIITGNLVSLDFTGATVGGSASGEWMVLTGKIPTGQMLDYNPDTATATDDVIAIDIDFDRAAADTGGNTGVNIHTTTGNMANAETTYGIKLGFDHSASTTATSILDGISIENITGNANVTENAIVIGSGWDIYLIANNASLSEAELEILDDATVTTAELNYLDITTLGTGAASKAVVLDGSGNYTAPAGTWDLSGVTGITLAANEITDADVVDTITASSYLPLSGGTMTGEMTADNLGIEFTAGDDHSDCTAFAETGGGIFYDDSDGKFKKCQDNVLSDLDTDTGGAPALSAVTAPTAAWSISFDDEEKVTWSTAQNTAGSFITIDNTTADVTNNVYLLELQYTDDGQANADYLKIVDNNTNVWLTIQEEGKLSIGSDPGDGGIFNLDNAAVISWEDATETTLTHVDNTGLAINLALDVQGSGGITLENDETITNSTDGTVSFSGGLAIPDAGNIGSASDLDAIAIAADGKTTFSQDMNLSEDLLIGDAKYIGSASDPDSAQIAANGEITLTQELQAGAGIDATGQTIIASAFTGTASLATTVTVSDDEATADNQEIVFTTDNTNLESDGDFHYNPSTGVLTVPDMDLLGAPFPDDPGADRVLMWDDSETGAELTWTAAGTGDIITVGDCTGVSGVCFGATAGDDGSTTLYFLLLGRRVLELIIL